MQLPRQQFRSLNQIDDDMVMAVLNEDESTLARLQQERESVLGQIKGLNVID